MKTASTNLPDDKAKKEIRQFSAGAVIGATLSILLPFLAVIGLAFGARVLVLSNHKANKSDDYAIYFRIAGIAAIVVSATSFINFLSS